MSAETIKQALIRLGYETRRVDIGGRNGKQILKNGEPVHSTPFANIDLAIELIEAGGGFRTEQDMTK